MRPDLEVVARLVQPRSHVLDLGCGDGTLLATLHDRQGNTGTGVDRDPASVVAAIRRGVSVIEVDIDRSGPDGLDAFADDSYDIVVVSQTLQTTRNPERILRQVRRIAGRGVVSVPNFGFWKHRSGLFFGGRMPVSAELPHPWYDTPNIHLSTLKDTEELFRAVGFSVVERVLLDSQGTEVAGVRARGPSNWMSAAAVYLIR